jgi:hypothetical protein
MGFRPTTAEIIFHGCSGIKRKIWPGTVASTSELENRLSKHTSMLVFKNLTIATTKYLFPMQTIKQSFSVFLLKIFDCKNYSLLNYNIGVNCNVIIKIAWTMLVVYKCLPSTVYFFEFIRNHRQWDRLFHIKDFFKASN